MIFFFLLSLSSSFPTVFIPSTKSPPAARSQSLMNYLQPRSSLLIFGGWNGESSFNDLWEFSLNSLTWSKILPSSLEVPGKPYSEPRYNLGGFSSPTDEKLYIFGGVTSLGPENDFWEFDFNSMKWERLKTFSTPSPRHYFGFTTYSISDTIFFVVQGGLTFKGAVNDMFRLNFTGLHWEKLPGNGEIPEPCFGPVLEFYEGKILQAAGASESGKNCLPYLYSYSLESLEWSVISDKDSSFECVELTQSYIYQNELFIVFGWNYIKNEDSSEVYKINLVNENKKWEKISIWPELAGDAFCFTTVGKVGYFFGGFSSTLQSHTNQLSRIDLDKRLHFRINPNIFLPKPRTHHSMVVLNAKFYVFGGVDSNLLFNDLWTFDILKNLWEQVNAKGEGPAPRHSHAANAEGDTFVVWGGEGLNGLRDDMFIFNSITSYWTQLISSSSDKPSPSKGACLVLKSLKVYIFGGKRESDFSNELWIYDIGADKFELLSSSPLKLSFPHCWIDSNLFYVSLGILESDAPSTEILFFNFSSKTWKPFHKHSLSSSDSAQSSQLFIENQLISIGGQTWMQTPIYKVSILKAGNKFSVLKSEISFNNFGSASSYFNKSLYIFGGGSVSGKTMFLRLGNNILTKIDVDELCLEDDCKASCSSGTVWNGKKCEICGEGTYVEERGKEKCLECLPGTYNNQTASTNSYQCLPCPEGTFNEFKAASSCKSCPDNKYCPIRSIKPLEKVLSEQSESFQPVLYEQPDLSETLLIYRVAVSAPLILLLIIFISIKKLREKFQHIDMFSQKHQNYENDYVVKKKTMIGACFSVLFVISALLLTCSAVLSYLKANIHETKGQVPLVVLESDVSSFIAEDITLKLTFISYGGECELNSKCNSLISFTFSNIFCSDTSVSCKMTDDDTCSIILLCKSGEIKTSAKIFFSLKETLSYSSEIKVNLTSSSSIPGQISSMLSVLASDSGNVFIGSVASRFYFLATPSLFKSESSEWKSKDTGYHISEKSSPLPGSQFTPVELPAVSYLNVEVNIETSSNALLTQRVLKQDFVIFVGAFLGSASGLFAIAGFAMSFFEKQVEKFVNRKKLNAVSKQVHEKEVVVRKSNILETTKIEVWGK